MENPFLLFFFDKRNEKRGWFLFFYGCFRSAVYHQLEISHCGRFGRHVRQIESLRVPGSTGFQLWWIIFPMLQYFEAALEIRQSVIQQQAENRRRASEYGF